MTISIGGFKREKKKGRKEKGKQKNFKGYWIVFIVIVLLLFMFDGSTKNAVGFKTLAGVMQEV